MNDPLQTIYCSGNCFDPTPGNGTAILTSTRNSDGTFPVGTHAFLSCHDGYQTTDSRHPLYYTCKQPGIWSPHFAECVPNSEGRYNHSDMLYQAHILV